MRQRFNIRGGRRFTLVEVLAALVIVALLVGVALPLFNKLTKSKNVDAAATTLQTKLRGCRSMAINDAERPARFGQSKIEGIGLLVEVTKKTETDGSTRFYLYRCRPGKVSVVNSYTQWEGLENANWTLLPNDIYLESSGPNDFCSETSHTAASHVDAPGLVLAFGGRGQFKQQTMKKDDFATPPVVQDLSARAIYLKGTLDAVSSVKTFRLRSSAKGKENDVIRIEVRPNGSVKQIEGLP